MRSETIILCLFLGGMAFCIPAPHITLAPFTEVHIGEAHEFVYYNDKILSELVWDMKPMSFLGLAAKASWDQSLQLTAEISGALPLVTGSMEDSDWLNLLSNGNTEKTTFSHHEAALKFAFRWSAEAGWDVPLPINGPWSPEQIRLTPLLGFRYMIWKWNANDGYAQHTNKLLDVYPAWNADMPKTDIRGTPITYMQEYWMPTLGLNVVIPAGSQIQVNLGITGSFWVYCNGTDNHFKSTSNFDYTGSTTSTVYYDLVSDGWLVEPRIETTWAFKPRWSVLFAARWTRIDGLRGNTAKQSSTGGTIFWSRESNDDGGGASLETVSFRLGVETKLR